MALPEEQQTLDRLLQKLHPVIQSRAQQKTESELLYHIASRKASKKSTRRYYNYCRIHSHKLENCHKCNQAADLPYNSPENEHLLSSNENSLYYLWLINGGAQHTSHLTKLALFNKLITFRDEFWVFS